MLKEQLIGELNRIYAFFSNTIEIFEEKDSSFSPAVGVYSTSQQIAHTAQSIDWFINGAFVNDKFDMNFEEQDKAVRKVYSIISAKKLLKKSIDNAISVIESKSEKELASLLPDGPIMGGAPKLAVIGAIADHTAHHRGALAVYARLVGKVPKMPYG